MSPTNDYGGVAEAARFQPKRSVTERKLLAKKEKSGLSWEGDVSVSQKEVSLRMISIPCIEVQTTSEDRFSVPAWFAEVVIIAGY